MIYCDIHTHRPPANPDDLAVVAADIRQPGLPETGYYAIGIHPRQADRTLLPLLRASAGLSRVAAIGETGLDKLAPTPWPLQEEVFAAQVRLAGEIRKPIIIHCVRAWQELMAVRKAVRYDIPWIIHGFRGNGTLAAQLLRAGFFLSFGARYHPEAVCRAWEARRLLAETDDRPLDIREVYTSLAATLALPEERLAQEILANVRKAIPSILRPDGR
ncbi:MAG: TatD family hydrolase [Tannerella sp.]|jgi:TatD DNase family protein|nr:TatD family hydrolase [Tannerella sp.]